MIDGNVTVQGAAKAFMGSFCKTRGIPWFSVHLGVFIPELVRFIQDQRNDECEQIAQLLDRHAASLQRIGDKSHELVLYSLSAEIRARKR